MEGGLPKVQVSSAKRTLEFDFMNKLFENVIETDNLKAKFIAKEETIIKRNTYIQRIFEKQMAFLENNKLKFDLSDSFQNCVKTFLSAKLILNKFTLYTHNYKYAPDLKSFYNDEFTNYADSLDWDMIGSTVEVKHAAQIISTVVIANRKSGFDTMFSIFNKPGIRDFVMSKFLYDRLSVGDTATATKYLTDYYRVCKDTLYTKEIAILAGLKLQKISTSKNDAVLVDVNGVKNTLKSIISQNKGKFIFIDFWASWCLPCKKEMPFSEKLIKSYQNRSIAFLYISVDEDYKTWRDDETNREISKLGSSFIMEDAFKNPFSRSLKLNAIPRYVIIDKNGFMSNADAPRPSNPELTKL